MKKLVVIILLGVSSVCGAAFIPNADPMKVLSVAGSSTTVGFQGVNAASVPVTGTMQVINSTIQAQIGNIVPVTGTFWQATQPISGQVSILEPLVLGATVTFNGTQPVQVLTSTIQVSGSMQVVTSTLQVQLGAPLPAGTNAVGSFTIGGGTSTVQGSAPAGSAAAGYPVQLGVQVSSNASITGTGDGAIAYSASDNARRQLSNCVPPSVMKSTYSLVMSSNGVATNAAGGTILISSPTATQRIIICGIVFGNTTATGNEAVLTSPPGSIGNVANTKMIAIPPTFVPSGYAPNCCAPAFIGAYGSNVGIYQSQVAGASAAIHYTVDYWLAP